MVEAEAQVLRCSFVSWKRLGSIQGISEAKGQYMWIEGSRDSYLQYIRELLKNKY